jgi:2-dehydro-3-deoxyphosphogluconate aldolase/(4S)-4-hydroxy-2-oxoglutarate aldolase
MSSLANFYPVLAQYRILPALLCDDPSLAPDIAYALRTGGLPLLEVTLRSPNALALLQALSQNSDIWIGAGTVLNVDQAKAAMDAGARFLVSPGLSPTLAEFALAQDIALIPGAVTATEIMLAAELGCPLVKFFPSDALGGVKTIRSLAAPLPHIRFLPTGGIHAGNMEPFLNFPSIPAVGGSWLVSPSLLDQRKWSEMAEGISQAQALIRGIPLPMPLP